MSWRWGKTAQDDILPYVKSLESSSGTNSSEIVDSKKVLLLESKWAVGGLCTVCELKADNKLFVAYLPAEHGLLATDPEWESEREEFQPRYWEGTIVQY